MKKTSVSDQMTREVDLLPVVDSVQIFHLFKNDSLCTGNKRLAQVTENNKLTASLLEVRLGIDTVVFIVNIFIALNIPVLCVFN